MTNTDTIIAHTYADCISCGQSYIDSRTYRRVDGSKYKTVSDCPPCFRYFHKEEAQ